MKQFFPSCCGPPDYESKAKRSRDGAVVEHSPPTNVARVRFPDSASYVG